ncbi:hypothetical protein PAEPH01_2704, partial [Pancytospora epiphaga]
NFIEKSIEKIKLVSQEPVDLTVMSHSINSLSFKNINFTPITTFFDGLEQSLETVFLETLRDVPTTKSYKLFLECLNVKRSFKHLVKLSENRREDISKVIFEEYKWSIENLHLLLTDTLRKTYTPEFLSMVESIQKMLNKVTSEFSNINGVEEEIKKLGEYRRELKELANSPPVRQLLSEEHTNGHDKILFNVFNVALQKLVKIDDMIVEFMEKYHEAIKSIMLLHDKNSRGIRGYSEECSEEDADVNVNEVISIEANKNQSFCGRYHKWSHRFYKILTDCPISDYNNVINERESTRKLIEELQKFFSFTQTYIKNRNYCYKEKATDLQKSINGRVNSIVAVLADLVNEKETN